MRYAVPLVFALLFSLLPATPALAQGGPCSRVDPLGREYAAWSGPWANHRATLDVQPQGCGILTWRAGQWCRPGFVGDCDSMQGDVIRYGGLAGFTLGVRDGQSTAGRIILISDQQAIRGKDIVLTLNDNGTLTAEWDNEPRTFCRTWAWIPDVCGA